MQFLIQREQLLQTLQMVMGAVEKRQTMPILGNTLIKAGDGKLELIATDLEVQLQGHTLLDTIQEAGETTVPARKLLDITRSLPEQSTLHIALEDHNFIVSSGKSRFKLMTLPAVEFPGIEESVNKTEFSLPQKDLRFLIERVHFSMAQQDVRYYLNGILLEVDKDKLCCVATDGHRLALCSVNYAEVESESRIIIPRKGVMELLRLLDNQETQVHLAVGNNQVQVSGAGFTFISKLIDGVFPDYHRVIPKNPQNQAIIERQELKQILSRIAVLSNEKYHGVKLMLRPGRFIVEAHNNDQEEAVDELSIEYQGEDLDIGFNVTYLLDVMNALPEGKIRIAFIDSNSSALIEDERHNQCLYVIMPMRL